MATQHLTGRESDRSDSHVPTARKRPWPSIADAESGRRWYAFVVLAASSYSVLTAWANAGENPILLTLLLAWLLLASLGIGIWRVLVLLGLDAEGSSYATALFMLVFANAGGLVGKFHPLDRLGLFLLAVGVGLIGYRLRQLAAFRLLVTWLVIFIVAYPMVNIVGRADLAQAGPQNVETSASLSVENMVERPDILVVFFDAYGSREVLDRYYQYDNRGVLEDLDDRGFEAPGTISANYARTQLAIPSFLQLDYVAGEGEVSDQDVDGLLEVLGGSNRLASVLKGQGYRQIHVESGWLGTRCGPTVDVCIGAPWPDETFFDIVYRSILTDIPGFEIGRTFTDGALHVADWLHRDLSRYLEDDQPDLIFAHVLMPHPPLFLKGDCSADWDGGVSGFAIGRRGADSLETDAARSDYIDQVECANHMMIETADMLGDDDAVLFMGDHGPDLLGQLFTPSSGWTEDQLRERFGTFFAARVPGCDMTNLGSVVNAGRRMMSCLSGEPFPDLPTRTYDLNRSPTLQIINELTVPTS
ncbi:MAG TPA: hypothetical protein VFP67_05790 [Acidimicrobiia bacterium]|nr:hypothetical protein [Acidimicrobiia bacterium]